MASWSYVLNAQTMKSRISRQGPKTFSRVEANLLTLKPCFSPLTPSIFPVILAQDCFCLACAPVSPPPPHPATLACKTRLLALSGLRPCSSPCLVGWRGCRLYFLHNLVPCSYQKPWHGPGWRRRGSVTGQARWLLLIMPLHQVSICMPVMF